MPFASFKTYPGSTGVRLYLVALAGATGTPDPAGYPATEGDGGKYTTDADVVGLTGEFEAYAENGATQLVWSGYWEASEGRCYEYTRPSPPSTGGGALEWVVAVEDTATDPVPGAVVTAIAVATVVAQGVAGAGGLVTLGLAPGDYTISVVAPGYINTTAAATVAASGGQTITLDTATAPPATPAATVVGYWVCYDETGAVEGGAEITVQLVETAGGTGAAVDSAPRTVTSAVDGLAYVPGLHPGCTYHFTRGGGPPFQLTIPADALGTIALDDIHGREVV